MRLHAIDVYNRWSMITICYERCRQGKLPSMASHERKLDPDYSNKDLRRDTSYRNDGCSSLGQEVEIRRQDHFWMFSCLSLLFSSWISAQYKWRRHGFYHLPLELEFPRAPDPPKGRPVRYRSVAGLIRSYEYVCRTFVWLFSFLSLYGGLQPRGSALKDGDDVTAGG